MQVGGSGRTCYRLPVTWGAGGTVPLGVGNPCQLLLLCKLHKHRDTIARVTRHRVTVLIEHWTGTVTPGVGCFRVL